MKQPNAAIVNVTSGLAFVPLLVTPTYNATKVAIYSYTIAIRKALKAGWRSLSLHRGRCRGGSRRVRRAVWHHPLDVCVDEVMTLLSQEPTPPELLVERVGFLRRAEPEGRFDQTVIQLNEFATKARGE